SLRKFPLEAFKVVAGIYWHAPRPKLKGAPFYTHPDKLSEDDTAYRRGHDDSGLDVTSSETNDKIRGRVSSWRT
ncbi:MAG TPA: DUF1365 domain-containing protein, partial [Marinobacter adhaerens]|nr:DUF1365 domain-containing protein [Marinobacter adhaerens]